MASRVVVFFDSSLRRDSPLTFPIGFRDKRHVLKTIATYQQARFLSQINISDMSKDSRKTDLHANKRVDSTASSIPSSSRLTEGNFASPQTPALQNATLSDLPLSKESTLQLPFKDSETIQRPSPIDIASQHQSTAMNSSAEAAQKNKTLSEMLDMKEGDCFVQLAGKEKLRTKDGKPYFKISFRDRNKSVQSLIWFDSRFFLECEKKWELGGFFKVRGVIRDNGYGAKLEIRKIRGVVAADSSDGFDPLKCQPSSSRPPEEILNELLTIAEKQLGKGALLNLIRRIFKDYRLELVDSAASRTHHHVYIGGLLEHTLSVTKISIILCEHFLDEFPTCGFSKSMVVAGAILHDVGKVLDSFSTIAGAQKTLAGNLIGRQILGLEIVERYVDDVQLDKETARQLEHLILTHARFQDWGSPSPPQTLEAMILHYADYADSTFASSIKILEEDVSPERFTQRKGPFGVPLMKPIRRDASTKKQTKSPVVAPVATPTIQNSSCSQTNWKTGQANKLQDGG